MTESEERNLVRRINRQLAHKGQQLHKTRGRYWQSELGDWYIQDRTRNTIIATKCDPENVAIQLSREDTRP